MGIYLHPMSQNPATLEALAGVPSGTYQRLLEVDANCPSQDNQSPEAYKQWEAYMDEISADPVLGKLDYFRNIGWGHIAPAALAIATEGGEPEWGGRATDLDLVRRILDAQGVNIQSIPLAMLKEGVGWG